MMINLPPFKPIDSVWNDSSRSNSNLANRRAIKRASRLFCALWDGFLWPLMDALGFNVVSNSSVCCFPQRFCKIMVRASQCACLCTQEARSWKPVSSWESGGIHEFDRDLPVTNYVMPSRMGMVCTVCRSWRCSEGLQELWCDVNCFSYKKAVEWISSLQTPGVLLFTCWVDVVNLGMDIVLIGFLCTNWHKCSVWGIGSFWHKGAGFPCNVEIMHHQNISKCVVVTFCLCFFNGHLSWLYIPVEHI